MSDRPSVVALDVGTRRIGVAATDAAGKMQKSLKRKFNRARQASITTELSEIIAGAAALN